VRTLVQLIAVSAWAVSLVAAPQLSDSIVEPSHPAIAYGGPTTDVVADLNVRLSRGEVRLEYEERTGYLRSLLRALDVPIESQIAVFSGTSLQARIISARNPRTIFFNDHVAVAWMSGGLIEVAALDPRQGASFYLLPQTRSSSLQLSRDTRCLQCHYATATLGVPGFLVRSIPSAVDGGILPWLGNYATDQRSPISERWGGWYVTGRGAGRHLGNAPIIDRTIRDVEIQPDNLSLASLEERFDTGNYLSPFSDIVALLVFDHQMQMMNLLIRLGWETRIVEYERRPDGDAAIAAAANEVVDYMLFVDEARLEPVTGSGGFAQRFTALGPRDRKGRSLRDLDLRNRLMQYPCSYMIYSAAFDALPAKAKQAVYERLWSVLSGADASPRYARLSTEDREAIVEILQDTKDDLPAFFSPRPSQP